jgi:predicted methyltransferase
VTLGRPITRNEPTANGLRSFDDDRRLASTLLCAHNARVKRRSLLLAFSLIACHAGEPSGPAEPTPNAEQGTDAAAALEESAVPSRPRPEEDVERDADRRPQEVLKFFEVQEGQSVVELMAGRGYYVDVIARVVGPTGKVYAHNSPFVLERFAEGPISQRLTNPALAHVARIDTELDAPDLPKGVDAVLMILFYHDTYWQEVDRAKMNAAVFEALEPGGIYGIVDHHAEPGSGSRDVKSLHRIEASLVEKEILAAGFELVEGSDLLAHPEDDRKTNVFDASIRGKTDRFILKFRKPG